MKKVLVVILALFTVMLTSCRLFDKEIKDDSDVITKEYEISDVDSLSIKNIQLKQGGTYFGANVYLCASDKKLVTVSTNEGINEKIKVENDNGALKIYGKKLETYVTKSIDIYVYGYVFNDINLSNVKCEIDGASLGNDGLNINLSGACSLEIEEINSDLDLDVSGATKVVVNKLTANKVNIDTSGASDMSFKNISTNEIVAYLSGASKFYLEGNTKIAKYYGSGASLFDVKECVADDVDTDLSGASDLYVSFNNSLKGNISGSSEVTYYGDSSKVDISKSGGSEVKKG